MGCIESSHSRETHLENDPNTKQPQSHPSPPDGPPQDPDGAPVQSHVMLRIVKGETAPQTLSQMGEACSRMDLAAIHKILVTTHYKPDDETNEYYFQEWTREMKDILEVRKRGDLAFRDKDFKSAIDCYSQYVSVEPMVSPTVLARRSLCYLLCDQPDPALLDAMQAQRKLPDWPTAFYLQSVSLAKLGMPSDATYMLNEAAILEEKRQKSYP